MKLKSGYISEAKVKLALVRCSEGDSCKKCPYYTVSYCRRALSFDALNYIIRLERKVVEYEKEDKS